MSGGIFYLELANGGWISADESGRIVAVSMSGVGEGSYELLRDAMRQGHENSRRWAEEQERQGRRYDYPDEDDLSPA